MPLPQTVPPLLARLRQPRRDTQLGRRLVGGHQGLRATPDMQVRTLTRPVLRVGGSRRCCASPTRVHSPSTAGGATPAPPRATSVRDTVVVRSVVLLIVVVLTSNSQHGRRCLLAAPPQGPAHLDG